MQTIITMECTECKRRNYTTTKNKSKHNERIEKTKHCRNCRRHTAHKETK